mgnify:FL=1
MCAPCYRKKNSEKPNVNCDHNEKRHVSGGYCNACYTK